MGVKGTVRLTRKQAEEKYVELRFAKMKRALMADAVSLEDDLLEDILEKWNDEMHGGEGFENYIISEIVED